MKFPNRMIEMLEHIISPSIFFQLSNGCLIIAVALFQLENVRGVNFYCCWYFSPIHIICRCFSEFKRFLAGFCHQHSWIVHLSGWKLRFMLFYYNTFDECGFNWWHRLSLIVVSNATEWSKYRCDDRSSFTENHRNEGIWRFCVFVAGIFNGELFRVGIMFSFDSTRILFIFQLIRNAVSYYMVFRRLTLTTK